GPSPGPDVGVEGRPPAEHLAEVGGQQFGGLRVLDVLDDPGVGARFVQLAAVAAQPLQRARARADPFDRGDFTVDREDRLDLQRAADPGAGAADAAALAQVLERVDGEPHLQRLAHLPGAGDRLLGAAARFDRRRGRKDAEAGRAAGHLGVVEVDALAVPALVDQPLARLVGGLEGARDRRGDVDRDDLLARVEQRLPDGEEVTDRGLRGGRPVGRLAQAAVEVVVVGDVELTLLLAVDRDVEADHADPLGGDHLGWQVLTAVADDRGIGAGGHRRQYFQTRTPELPPPSR